MRRRVATLVCALSLALPALARAEPPLKALAVQVYPAAMRVTIERLVAFGTRHTLSDTTSPTRGIGAARRWAQGRFEAIGRDCGGCLRIVTPTQTVTGARIPTPTVIQDVLAIQRGTSDPDRVVIISGHIDSRITDVMNATSDAPGANDDGSGTAAVLEAARVLSKHKFPATLVYAVLSGEEQGLYGGHVLADYARAQGWRVEAQLNNDIIGNIHGQGGETDAREVRIFSEGTRAPETPAQVKARRSTGGEVDSPSRNLSRYLAALVERDLPGFSVRMIWRADRFSRGGDQAPMQEAGFPAVRLTEAAENYTRQHQDVRTEGGVRYGDVADGVDFQYLAQVTRVNVIGLAALASAPPPPTDVKLAGAVTADTTVSWTASPGASGYRVWWRETSAPRWEQHRDAGAATSLKLTGVNIDDVFFGVSALAPDGSESPVEFPGVAGAFVTPPPQDPPAAK